MPVVSAAENQINVTYIGLEDPGLILQNASLSNPYSDQINYTFVSAYDGWSVSDEVTNASSNGLLELLADQDVIFCDMLYSAVYEPLNDTLYAAHLNGTSMLAIQSADTPEYFDYVSNGNDADKICTYYYNMDGSSYSGIKSAENLLIYLARDYGNSPFVTDNWLMVNITYVAYDPSAPLTEASKTNPYAEFVSFTYLPSYNKTDFNISDELVTASESGFLSQQDIIFCDMIFYNDFYNDTFYPAHESGASLVDVKSYGTPEYFDYVSNGSIDDKICTYYGNAEVSGPGLKSAENFLMHLSRDYGNHPEITDEWPQLNFTYVYYTNNVPLENAVLTNPYAEFIEFTYLPSYSPDWSNLSDELIAASESGFLSQQDVIFCDMIGYNDNYNSTFLAAQNNGSALLDINSARTPSFFDYISNGTENDTIYLYYGNMGTDTSGQVNAENLLIYSSREYANMSFLTKGWILSDQGNIIPPVGLYHPDYENRFFETTEEYLEWYGEATGDHHVYDPEAPTIGMWFHRNDVTSDQLDVVDALVVDIESKGCNVIAGFDTFDDITSYYCDEDETPLVQSVISLKSFRLNYWDNERGIEELEHLDVPVLRGIVADVPTNPDPADANRGIPNSQMVYKTIAPNVDGIFEYILIGNAIYDPDTETTSYVPLDSQIDWITNRSIKWANLKLEENSDKKVAVIYYNYPSGKDNIGASYLDTITSMRLLLEEMEAANYTVSNIPENNSALLEMLQSQGINAGSWAPQVLDEMVENKEDWGLQLIPMEQYHTWFEEEVPQDLQNQVIAEWGAPWDDDLPQNKSLMMWENESGKYLVIPAVQFDNVWLMPQPARGFLQNDDTLYHSTLVPPPHQYIGFYLWLNKEWQPDAIIHFGTHGTHEWLPGQTYGLNRTAEWAPVMLQDLPNIYPYIVANVGEGLTAEYRGNALIIDHLTPTLERSGSYGEIANLSQLMQTYYGPEMSEQTKQAYQMEIIDEMVGLNLDIDLGLNVTELYSYNTTQFGDFIKNVLHEYVEEIEGENIPYGMHILGEVPSTNMSDPTRDELSAMVWAMLGNKFDENVTLAFYPEDDYPLGMPSNDTRQIQMVWEVVTNETGVNDSQILVYGEINGSVTADLERGLIYRDRLLASAIEMDRVVGALSGEYIPAGPGTDPVMNPAAVPTGRNFYGVDPELYPSEATWRMGQYLAEQLLQDYYEQHGEYPRKVSFSRFGTEFIRDHGTLEAEILYLLGVEPDWDGNKKIDLNGFTLIPEEELGPSYGEHPGRPRIDIVYATAGMRDAFPSKIQMIDYAVHMASEAPSVNYPNYVNESSSAIYDELYAQFIQEMNDEEASSLARQLSTMRCFAVMDGTYEIGTGNAIDSSDSWDDESTIAELYLQKMGYVYGQSLWGFKSSELLIGNLRNVDASVHSDSSNLYDTLDNDDFFQYFGALNLATRYVSGETPEMYVSDTRDPDAAKMVGMQEYLMKNLRSRYWNPKWVEGMQDSGYAGGRMFSEFVDNLWGWEVSDPELVDDTVWQQTYEIYTSDEMKDWFNENNPYAYQSVTGRMIEAIRKGYWTPSEEVVEKLVKDYAESVEEYGVSCCHHTCGNPLLDSYVNGILSAPTPTVSRSSNDGSLSAKVVESSSMGSGNQTSLNDGGYGESLAEPTPESNSNYVEGYEMTRESQQAEESGGMSFSGADIIGTLFVLAAVGAISVGLRRRRL
ncbi:cobaltochelatase subunit CobN [Methanococcoides methylutens]|uniref:cobaltochelatase subunit CobN n=1 Tax=Methanococcoides methylutens TaxID=2226 RepID=UPI0040445D07